MATGSIRRLKSPAKSDPYVDVHAAPIEKRFLRSFDPSVPELRVEVWDLTPATPWIKLGFSVKMESHAPGRKKPGRKREFLRLYELRLLAETLLEAYYECRQLENRKRPSS